MALRGFMTPETYESIGAAIRSIDRGTALGLPGGSYTVWEVPAQPTQRMIRYVPSD